MAKQVRVNGFLAHKAKVVREAARDSGDVVVFNAAGRVTMGYYIARADAHDVAMVRDFFGAISS